MSDALPFGIHTLVIPFTGEGGRAASPVTGRMTRMRPPGWLHRPGPANPTKSADADMLPIANTESANAVAASGSPRRVAARDDQS